MTVDVLVLVLVPELVELWEVLEVLVLVSEVVLELVVVSVLDDVVGHTGERSAQHRTASLAFVRETHLGCEATVARDEPWETWTSPLRHSPLSSLHTYLLSTLQPVPAAASASSSAIVQRRAPLCRHTCTASSYVERWWQPLGCRFDSPQTA